MGLLKGLVKSIVRGREHPAPPRLEDIRLSIEQGELDRAEVLCRQLVATRPPQHEHPELEAKDLCLRGEIAYARRQDPLAERCFRDALRLHPGSPDAHYDLSLVLAERGADDEAIRHAHFAMHISPTNARVLAQVGYCHVRVSNFQMAELPLRRASFQLPKNPYVWNNLGITLRAKGAGQEAVACFERALRIKPDFASAADNLARLKDDLQAGAVQPVISIDTTHWLAPDFGTEPHPILDPVLLAEQEGDIQQAMVLAERLLLEYPDDPRIAAQLAGMYERSGDSPSAVNVLEAFLGRQPTHSGALGALGLTHLRAQNYKSAEASLALASAANPEHVDYLLGHAHALSNINRFADAGPLLERADALRPNNIIVLSLLAANLSNRCQYEDAIELLSALPGQGARITGLGTVLLHLGRLDEAQEAFDTDLAKHPLDASLRFQRGTLHLLKGEYQPGWEDYAMRGLGSSVVFRTLPFPLWQGESLQGKSVIVIAEQGLGDQVMFASCLPDLLALGPKHVVLEVIDRVAPTIQRAFPTIEVVATSQGNGLDWVRNFPNTDYAIHLGDLPRHFRRTLEDFPRHNGYLRADPERTAYWRKTLEEHGPSPYIGLSWRGGTELTRSPLRTMRPEMLAPLHEHTKGTFVCLQYGQVAEDMRQAADHGLKMLYSPESIANLDEFAALICALDLIITVCNTTVHYAGALAKPTWVMAPTIPEWRYGVSGAHMPWYPTVTIHRQPTPGDWSPVIITICQKLSSVAPMGPGTRD